MNIGTLKTKGKEAYPEDIVVGGPSIGDAVKRRRIEGDTSEVEVGVA